MSIGASSGIGTTMTTGVIKDTVGASVVTKTLETLNKGPAGSASAVNSDFEMQKAVLSSAVTGKGAKIDVSI